MKYIESPSGGGALDDEVDGKGALEDKEDGEGALEDKEDGEGTLQDKEDVDVKQQHESMADCFPFYSIILALNRTRIDYFSLDVEGKELDILKTIPFDKLDIKVLTVEYIHIPEGIPALITYMNSKGYYKHSRIDKENPAIAMFTRDIVFVKNGTPIPIQLK
jgi:hypothetical protein